MPDLPAELAAAVRRAVPDAPVAAVRTAGLRPFGILGGPTCQRPIWCVITDHHALLAAADGDDGWVVGTGADDALHLERGWVADTLTVGRHSTPLRAGRRRSTRAVTRAWAEASRGGAPVEPPPEPPSALERGAAAVTVELPEGWVAEVPAPAGSRWLAARETATTWGFADSHGSIHTAPVWVGVADTAVVLAALQGGQVASRTLTVALRREVRAGRVLLVGEGVELLMPLLSPGTAAELVELASASASERHAIVARAHLRSGDVRAATAVWKEALRFGRGAASLVDVARLAWSSGAAAFAEDALRAASREGELPPIRLEPWLDSVDDLPRAVRGDAGIAGALRTALEGGLPHVPPALPADLPPPATARELLAAALVAEARHSEALAVLARAEPDARAAMGVAAVHEAAGQPGNAAAAYAQAATRHREAGEVAASREALGRSISLAPRAAWHWRAATWCWLDHKRSSARDHWLQALETDPDGASLADNGLDSDGWRQLAALAEGLGAWRVAARAWGVVGEAAPLDPTPAHALARILADELNDREEAAKVLDALAAGMEGSDDPDSPRRAAEAWLEAAALVDGDEAVARLRHAVEANFLHVATWRTVLDHRAEALSPALLSWWTHLDAVLHGGAARRRAAALKPVEGPARASLGAEGSWWSGALASLEAPELPNRAMLIRGLDPLRDTLPEAWDLTVALCEVLEVRPPDAFAFRGGGAWGACAWPTNPPVLLVGADHAPGGDRALDRGALRALLAVEVAHLALGHPPLRSGSGLMSTGQSLYGIFGSYAGTAESLVDLITLLPGVDQLTKLQKVVHLSRKVFTARSVVDKAGGLAGGAVEWFRGNPPPTRVETVGREGLDGVSLRHRLHADRVALSATGDLGAAVDAMIAASSTAGDQRDRVVERGLADLLGDPASGLADEELVRLTSLVTWAVSHAPLGVDATSGSATMADTPENG